MRRIVHALLLLLTTLPLAGCLAVDDTGVRLGENGVPTIVNCGTYIERVDVTDAETGRRVWSAHAVGTPNGGIPGAAAVLLGSRPDRDWVEDSPLALEPRPAAWRFEVEALDEEVILVSDAELEPDRV